MVIQIGIGNLTRPYKILAIVLAFFSPSLLVYSNSNLETQENDRLFLETVHILGGVYNRVPKWRGVVRVAVVGSLIPSSQSRIITLFDRISLYTGLNIQLLHHDYKNVKQYSDALTRTPNFDLTLCDQYNPAECANFIIIVSSQSDMQQIARNLPMRPVFQNATSSELKLHCFFSPGLLNRYEIKKSIVFVNVDLDEDMLHTCLNEEVMQSFGMFNDYSDSTYFSFNNIVAVKQLTVFDMILLSSLYDRAFPHGTTADKIARQIVSYCNMKC